MARKLIKTKRLHIKISEEEQQMINKRADELNLTISEYIRRLVLVDVAKSEK